MPSDIRSNNPRMHSHSNPFPIINLLLQSPCKKSQIKLRTSIGKIFIVFAVLEVEFAHIQGCRLPEPIYSFVGDRTQDNNPEIGRVVQFWPQQMREIEMADVVYAAMRLEPGFGEGESWQAHNSSIIDQKINFRIFYSICEIFNTLQISKIQPFILDSYAAYFLIYFIRYPQGIDHIGYHNFTSLNGQLPSCLLAKPTPTPCDNRHTPPKVRPNSHIDPTPKIPLPPQQTAKNHHSPQYRLQVYHKITIKTFSPIPHSPTRSHNSICFIRILWPKMYLIQGIGILILIDEYGLVIFLQFCRMFCNKQHNMFSDQLIDQLSMFIIRPHREIYGLDKLGPKKLIIKSASLACYIEVYRQECTILSEGKKIQLSIFQPHIKLNSNGSISSANQMPQYLTKSVKVSTELYSCENPNEVTIFLHTNSGSRLEGLEYSKYLLQHGHILCLFDYSGSGVSEGEFVSMGLNQSKDLANVVKFMQQKFDVQKVSLWGRSMGAVTAVLYCAKNWKNVKKMVLDSPFCSFRQLVKEIVNSRTGLPQFLFGAVLNRIEQNLNKKLQVNLMDIDLKQEIVRPGMQKIPIFFLISKDDKLVQPSHVQTLYQLHKGFKKILYLQGSHNKPRPSQIRQQCAQFLCQKISNVSSQKTIDNKRQYLSLISRKYSEQIPTNQRKTKLTSTSMVFNPPQVYLQEEYQFGFQNHQNNGQFVANQSVYQQPLFLNLNKKNKHEQSSAQSTPRESRDDHSHNKYSGSKISLSQIKKSQAEGEGTPVHAKNMPIMINPLKGQADFKKQSRTMAIQYKNKIKQYINKT